MKDKRHMPDIEIKSIAGFYKVGDILISKTYRINNKLKIINTQKWKNNLKS